MLVQVVYNTNKHKMDYLLRFNVIVTCILRYTSDIIVYMFLQKLDNILNRRFYYTTNAL